MKREVVQRYNNQTVENNEDSHGVDNHMGDSGTAQYEQEKNLSLKENDAELLQEINDSLEKIDEGTYGICIDTGEDISKERLNAIPYAKRTIQAQKSYDKGRNNRGDKSPNLHSDPAETIKQLNSEQDAFKS